MLATSPARIAAHAELAALAAAFFAARAPVAAAETAPVSPKPVRRITCDRTTGWATRYLGLVAGFVRALNDRIGMLRRSDGALEYYAFSFDRSIMAQGSLEFITERLNAPEFS